MDIVWDHAEVTTRQVQEALRPRRDLAYTSVLTMMMVLERKGFICPVVTRRRSRAYKAVVTRERIGARSLSEIVNNFFAGSVPSMLRQLVEADVLSDDDMTGVRRLIERVAGANQLGEVPGLLLQAAFVQYVARVKEGQVVRAATLPWLAMIKELERARDLSILLKLSPRQFEELIAAAYEADGWNVILTPRSRDFGRDVIAVAQRSDIGEMRIIDQVKKYAPGRVVTAEECRALLHVLDAERNVSKGFITTTAQFAPGIAKDPTVAPWVPNRLTLRDGKGLLPWLLARGGDCSAGASDRAE